VKDKSGLIVSTLLMLFGLYTVLTTLRSEEEEIALIGDIPIYWGFALMFGLIGLFTGVIVLTTWLSKRRLRAEIPPYTDEEAVGCRVDWRARVGGLEDGNR
jgi:hypothetical protein